MADATKRTGTTPIPALPTPILPTIGGGAPSPIKTFGAGEWDPGLVYLQFDWVPGETDDLGDAETDIGEDGGSGPTGGSGTGGGGSGGAYGSGGGSSTGGSGYKPVLGLFGATSGGCKNLNPNEVIYNLPTTAPFTPALRNDIYNAADKYGISPTLLAAIGLQESGMGKTLTANGTSKNGKDYGIWQINAKAAASPPLSLTPAQIQQCATDPAFCAMQAAKLLAHDLNFFKGNVTKAIEAYHSGINGAGSADSIAYMNSACDFVASLQ